MIATKEPRERGRPRSFVKEDAVATAMRLFHQRGYDAVGVAELCAALGIKPPSFYAAFGSKLGLFEQALRHYAAGPANIFARALEGGGGVDAVIGRTFREAARLYPACDGVAGCLVIDGARNSADAEARALGACWKADSRRAIRDFIAAEYPAKADRLADLVTTALAGMSAAARDGADADMLGDFAGVMERAFRAEAGRADD
ncbi:putative transcriptional regulator [Sphingomonas sp. MM-1]|uniref:TetR/AcrR family transcriptional regulator n=1 Tax=Sphingomonas sp. MM-1 TaxID=745310 RepID=UPI0002C0E78C|nr:TetR/AcrR family transcriptional regulator [Sphingomonas sp. MM-1]AGH49711.1 putative transcriptional regulator [Sphingomonas sp. MM-1]